MKWLIITTACLWCMATVMGFVYPNAEQSLGEVQRLFYIHFGTFYSAFCLLLVAVISGVGYLKTAHPFWDHLQKACIEVGLWFLTVTILTGMFIARPVWGAYWTWDPRLTSVAVMWLTYMAYFFLRNGIDAPSAKRRFSAVYAIVAFASVVMSMLALRMNTNLTAPVLDFTSLDLGMSPRIGITIWVNIVAYGVLGSYLVSALVRLARATDALTTRKMQLLEEL